MYTNKKNFVRFLTVTHTHKGAIMQNYTISKSKTKPKGKKDIY